MYNEYQRFAVYFSPQPDTALARFGRSWFGSEDKILLPAINELIESPKRYGFHATLKAPMRLSSDILPKYFVTEVENLARELKQVELGNFYLGRMQNFLALRPENHNNELLETLAWRCVTELDYMRAPLNKAELDKRPGLSEEEFFNLKMWGYPFVGKLFQFHMTLTSSLNEQKLKIACSEIKSRLGNALDDPVKLDSLCIFGDPGGTAPFKLVRRFRLKA